MRVVITRAEDEAVKMGQAIHGIGCTPLVASMMEIELSAEPIDLTGFQGVLATSANAVRALEQANENRDIPIFCVGPQTRNYAESVGYKNVTNSFGGSKNLPIYLQRETTPAKGPILFLHGGNIAGNPIQELKSVGFRVVGRKVYGAAPIKTLPDDVRAEFEKDVPPEIVTFMSIRTFKLFRDVMQSEGLLPKLRGSMAVCISTAVADFAREVRWKKVYIADEMSGPSIVSKVAELKESAGAPS